MPQGPGIRAGVLEGHVPELDLVLPVGALLGGEAALVHVVGDVQKVVGELEVFRVGPQVPYDLQQAGEPLGQTRQSAHVLGDGPHPEGPAQGLQSGEEVDDPHERLGHRARGGGAGPHGPPGPPGDGGGGSKGTLALHLRICGVFQKLILGVGTDVRSPVALLHGDEVEEGKAPVARRAVVFVPVGV